MTYGSVPYSVGATGLSHLPLCFDSMFGVTVESVQRSQVYLEWIGTSGSFQIVARPLEFLSSVKLRPPILRCDGNAGNPFPVKQRNGNLSRDEEGKPGLLSCARILIVPFEWRQVCRGTSLVVSRVSRTLLRLKREGGISLKMWQ